MPRLRYATQVELGEHREQPGGELHREQHRDPHARVDEHQPAGDRELEHEQGGADAHVRPVEDAVDGVGSGEVEEGKIATARSTDANGDVAPAAARHTNMLESASPSPYGAIVFRCSP